MTDRLVAKHRELFINEHKSRQDANRRVRANLELLQLVSPFPLLQIANDEELLNTSAKGQRWLSHIDTAWRKLYKKATTIEEDSCELAFLRPTCTYNPDYFPPVLCEPSCHKQFCSPFQQSRQLHKDTIEVTVLKRVNEQCSARHWQLETLSLTSPTFNSCHCEQGE